MAKKIHQPAMDVTKPHAPPAYGDHVSSMLSYSGNNVLGRRRKAELTTVNFVARIAAAVFVGFS
jgi:hypothetical protein